MNRTFVEQRVTYTFEKGGKLIVVEHVPARVCVETGERFFAPDVVERMQKIVWEDRKQTRKIETLVFDFAAYP
jgi:YgiT-type zinc finger domain-containing protein